MRRARAARQVSEVNCAANPFATGIQQCAYTDDPQTGRGGAWALKATITPPCLFHQWFSVSNVQGGAMMAPASAPRYRGCRSGSGVWIDCTGGGSCATEEPHVHVPTITAARLVHGTSVNSGILQVQTDGARWGYVCDDSFDQDDFGAQVAGRGRGEPAIKRRCSRERAQ